ncbi:unnamed protein product [Blepharisma stoltei]|uniref:Uncharacterized protein n=1 Tax=Blepharisma stoltei TaxID=1481888 RepID=A0AAU9IL91_9CILI|nr:unnamed protein product [Blepharisma stoltei]
MFQPIDNFEENNEEQEPNFEQDETHKPLLLIRSSLNAEPNISYASELEIDGENEGVKLPSEFLDKEQKEIYLENKRLDGLNKLTSEHQDFQLDILNKEQKSRNKLKAQYNKQIGKIKYLEDHSAHKHQQRQVLVSKAFRKQEMKLKYAIKKKKGDLRVTIDDSVEGLMYGGGQRLYQVSWKGRPQPVEVRIDECRDIKDKLIRGDYWLKVVIKDRIGGAILSFNKCIQEWRNMTDPLFHDGKHASKSMKFLTTLLVLAPSEIAITPTMVYCFQLLDSLGAVVGEGYFPLINNCFELVEGKFKVPILRNSIRSSIDKFSDLEALYRRNIDEWLCNLYFQTHKQIPLLKGEKQVIVHLMTTQDLQEEYEYDGAILKEYEELLTPEQFEEHKFSVVKTGFLTTPRNKLSYLMAEIMIELGFKTFKHLQIYVTFLLLIACIWSSRYIHYGGEWLYLKAIRYPVTVFKALAFTLDMEYPNQLTLSQEIGAILTGQAFCILWFIFFSLVAFGTLLVVGRFPAIGFRIIQCWGIITVIDPIITLIECIIRGFVYDFWDGDSFRLYNYFETWEGNGVIGIMMTLFLYAGMMGIASFCFYNYFLYVHMNGRLLDIYMRINGPEESFFIPHDGEISKRYLDWICYKARNYRSINGDSRKIAISTFDFTDSYDSKYNMHAQHVSVYNVANDRSRTLYRHFVVLPDGAICELSQIEKRQNNKKFSDVLKGY